MAVGGGAVLYPGGEVPAGDVHGDPGAVEAAAAGGVWGAGPGRCELSAVPDVAGGGDGDRDRRKRAGEGMMGHDVELVAKHRPRDEMEPYERLLGEAMRGEATYLRGRTAWRRRGGLSIRCWGA